MSRDRAAGAEKRVLCVLGMHRSGTSLVAAVARSLGYDFGPDSLFIEAREDNPMGFWELEPIQTLNDELLSRLGGSWIQPPDLPEDWSLDAANPWLAEMKDHARSVIAACFGNSPAWGWKDPRTSLTLRFWRDVATPTHAVICIRNPVDVASSLFKRDRLTFEQSVRLWLRYTAAALHETARDRTLLVFYDDLMADPLLEVQRIASFLKPSTDEIDLQQVKVAATRVERPLKHHATSDIEVAHHPALSFAAKSLYFALRSLRRGEPEASKGTPLGEVAREFAGQCLQLLAQDSARSTGECDIAVLDTTRPVHDLIQVFWDEGSGLSEDSSTVEQYLQDGRWYRLRFDVPNIARDTLRIDPGTRVCYVEIERIALFGLGARNELIASSSADNTFAGLTATRDAVEVQRGLTYKVVSIGDDPQILLGIDWGEREYEKYSLEIRFRALADYRETVAGELIVAHGLLESERKRRQHLETEVIEVRARLAQSDQSLTAALDDAVSTKQRLDAASYELSRIKASMGWRILNRFGRLKQKHLIPVLTLAGLPLARESAATSRVDIFRNASPVWQSIYRRMGNLLRLRLNVGVEPREQLQPGSEPGSWIATGIDPQFALAIDEPAGWVSISVSISAPEAAPFARSRLYIDRGEGLSEDSAYDMGIVCRENKVYAYLGPAFTSARFDPIDEEGTFKLAKLEVRRATWLEAKVAVPAHPLDVPQQPAQDDASVDQQISVPMDPYDAWLEVNTWNKRRAAALAERLAAIPDPPLLSVIMPVYNSPPEFLDLAIRSVVDQLYGRWELCIADDLSTDPEVRNVLERWARSESRIKITFRDRNGNISRAANSAARLASGDYLLFLDHDDELTPDALAEVAIYIEEHPETEIIYSDEDKIDLAGGRYDPWFKPDWSPELLISFMYMAHLFVIRRALFNEVGGFRTGFEGSQDHDLALRATEGDKQVAHIPKVLYHWRALPASTASSGAAKPASFEAGRKAVEEAFGRRGVKAEVIQPGWAKEANCAIFSHVFPDDGPLVTVLIPTRNNVAKLRPCLESLKRTTYHNFEIVVIDNGSDDPQTLSYLKRLEHRVIEIPNVNGKFSFAHINNEAVRQVDSEYVLFLNDDTEIINPRWLSQMVGYLGLDGVGAVGARLVFSDGRIQHAGVVHGYFDGSVGHAFKLLPARDPGYMAFAGAARNYSAVTAACMITPRKLFLEMGGFDEKRFNVAFNDVDYCYRLLSQGLRMVYCPTAELIHHEGASRGWKDDPREVAALRLKYGEFADPYYNPNLKRVHERFEVDSKTLPISRMRPVRILMCTHNLNLEGAPFDQLEMTVGLKKQGIIDPIVYSPEEGPLRQEYERAEIRVEVFPHPLANVMFTPSGYRKGIRHFADFIRETNAEVVYANTLLTFYAIEAAASCGLPSVWNLRESDPIEKHFSHFGEYVTRRAQMCFTYPYRVVFTANASLKVYEHLGTHHNFVNIYDGLDRDGFLKKLGREPRGAARKRLGLTESEIAVISVGTVCERKGQKDIVDAMPYLMKLDAEAVRRVRLFIVGDRPSEYSVELREAIEQLPSGIKSRIEIVPATVDVFAYYSAADVYLCMSRSESFPRVILEAMAAGLPIMTTPVHGIKEQVKEDFNALFYNPGDIRTLATKLQKLIRDNELRETMGRNSPIVLDTIIDYDSMVKAYGQVFQEAWLSGTPRAYEPIEIKAVAAAPATV